MIPNEVIDQIRDHDLVAILQDEGLTLKREGANYKCCCPFHNEKTPSFVVSPSRNIAHCFGCNETWDAIGFVRRKHAMTFYEAVEYLAGKLHIQYEKREPTPEEREAQYHRDRLMAVNAAAQEYFQESFRRSPAAIEYCKGRGWSDETVQLFGIGFAPRGGGLCRFLLGKGWKKDLILEAGLAGINDETGELYDAFRERIVFPVWSKTGYIAGFTGRYVGDNEDVAKRMKYVNTKENDLFQKRNMLFGWFQAARQVSTGETVVICEGNPDVIRLHQIGIGYAVAPMGTALTKENVEFLKKKAKSVIIAGDMDASGIKATQEHGEALLQAGLRVRVMTWEYQKGANPPDPKDPDEYFLKHPKGWADALSRNTEDFLPWMAKSIMEGKATQTEVAAAITEVCRLLAMVRDENAVEMYLAAFVKEWKNQKVWNTEYYKAKNAIERREVSKDEKSREMIKEYGFYVKDNCYYGAASSSNDRRWSNFILVPILHIRDEKNARRIFRIVNSKHQESVIKFAQSELVSFADFKTRIETAGNYIWEVSAAELTQLKKYLYDDTPSADEIRQLGWQKRWGFYAWGNGGLDDGHFEKADKFGIVEMRGSRFYLPGCAADTIANTSGYQLDRKFTYSVTNDVTLRDFSTRLIQVFGDNAKVALCFLVATLFKDVVTSVTTSFPILNLFGPKGTGKSELGHSLTAFFITGNAAPNISNTTKAALAEAVAEVSNAIVHLDEYKNDIDLDKREFLKGLWDGTGRSRMNMDNDKKRETTAVDCGVVMSGQEMPTADIALFNRLVFLTFAKTTFSDAEKQAYEDLKRIEKRGLTHLTGQMLQLRKKFVGGFRLAWDDTVSDMSRRVRTFGVEDRTLKNWCTVLAAYRTLESALDFPFNYQEMLDLCASLCVDQNNKTRQSNELSGFWEILETLVSSSRIWINIDYKIRDGSKPIRTKESRRSGGEFIPNPDRRYLLINFKRISSLYQKEGRDTRGKTIPSETLRYYLEHSPEFMGTCEKVKFKMAENQQGWTPQDDGAAKAKVTTAMVFDYDAVQATYGISLDVMTGYSDEDEGGVSLEASSDMPLFGDGE
ncbi:MAG: DNA primase [Bacteroidales bacterium]|nr:DNA primase [Bacteroidales bacterium]